MGQVHGVPAVAGRAAAQGDRQPDRQAEPRRPLAPSEGRPSPWADPAAQHGAGPAPVITRPFLAAVLARVADSLCGPDRDGPQAWPDTSGARSTRAPSRAASR
jgi:hypothetical protein